MPTLKCNAVRILCIATLSLPILTALEVMPVKSLKLIKSKLLRT